MLVCGIGALRLLGGLVVLRILDADWCRCSVVFGAMGWGGWIGLWVGVVVCIVYVLVWVCGVWLDCRFDDVCRMVYYGGVSCVVLGASRFGCLCFELWFVCTLLVVMGAGCSWLYWDF